MTAVEYRGLSTPDIIVENATSLTASRRAGNLWTSEARDDMFNRRERGEPWESICQDYPTRSRHAMQQQYSMMKKQRMMADGTWTNNRRGRKRKVLPSAPSSLGPRRESGLETTEDEIASVTPSDLDPDDPDDMAVDEIDLGTPGPESNGSTGPSQSVLDFRPGRPSGLSRSATDPAPAPRGRGRGRGRVASTYTHADSNHPPLAPKGFTPVNEDSKPSKRSLLDNVTPPAPKRQKSRGETPVVESQVDLKAPFSETSVYFTKDDITTFFKKGIENGEKARRMLDEDSMAREKAFQEAQGRANRRAYEAEERIKEMGYRHRSDIRLLEHGHAEKMENLQYDLEQKIDDLTKQLAAARGVDPASITVSQQISKPAESQQQQQQSTAPSTAANESTSESQDPSVESKVFALVTNLEELKGRFETERELRKKAEARATTVAQERTATALQNAAPEFLNEFQQLEGLVSRLHSEVGDLTPNALAKSLAEIRARCAQCASLFRPPPPQQQQQQQHQQVQQPQQSQPPPQLQSQSQMASFYASPPSPRNGQDASSRGTPPASMQIHAVAPPPPQPPSSLPPISAHSDSNHPTPYTVGGPTGPQNVHQPSQGSHLLPMSISTSPTPSPHPAMRPLHDSHQGSSETQFENTPYEHKRSTPVTIHQLLQQEPAVAPPPNLPPPPPSQQPPRQMASSPPYDQRHPPPPLSAPMPAPIPAPGPVPVHAPTPVPAPTAVTAPSPAPSHPNEQPSVPFSHTTRI